MTPDDKGLNQPTGAGDNATIDASPTKDFFIHIVTRDIELVDAIADLVDNSVDAARSRVKPGDSYDGLRIDIEATPARFRISDNCGGMSSDVAQHYAFRFGREPGANYPVIENAVGQFGIGMKRALFKLGREFRIESKTDTEAFVIDINVDEWKGRDKWEFELKREALDGPEPGLTVTVTKLDPSIASLLALENYVQDIRDDLTIYHHESLRRGLRIGFNKQDLVYHDFGLIAATTDDGLKPANFQQTLKEEDCPEIRLRILAGLTEPLRPAEEAGWYIFLNDRLVVMADQSSLSGWGTTGLPLFHPEYNRFRGFAYLDCSKTSCLPWTTTKRGIDTSSGVYRAALAEMVKAARPIVDFINDLKRESKEELRPLTEGMQEADLRPVSGLTHSQSFVAPVRRQPRIGWINYSKPIEELDRVKKQLGASSYREAGERTFDYYLRMECED